MKPEELRAKIASGTHVIVSCARWDGRTLIHSNYLTGYRCDLCGAELQVSPVGVKQIAAGAITVCNPCGIAAAELKQAQGMLAGLVIPEEVADYIKTGGGPHARRLDDLIKRSGAVVQSPEPDELVCDFCGAVEVTGMWYFPHKCFLVRGERDKTGKVQELEFVAGEWAACDRCARLVELAHIDALIEVCAKAHGSCPGSVRRAYRELIRNRTGPPQWRHV